MEEKTSENKKALEGRDDMEQGLPKKNMRRLWEWQKYVKKETQRLQKNIEKDSKPEAVKPPLPKGPEKKQNDDRNHSSLYEKTNAYEDVRPEPKPREISTKDLDKIETVEDFDQDLDELMENHEDFELDENLKQWIEPEISEQKAVINKLKPKPVKTAPEETKKPVAKSKTETLTLFNKEIQKARKKQQSPRKTREHLIENLLDPVISLDEAAVILNVCKTTVRRYTNAGKLECLRTPGNQRRFRLSDVLEFLEDKEGKKASQIKDD